MLICYKPKFIKHGKTEKIPRTSFRGRINTSEEASESKKNIRKRINILMDLDEDHGKALTYEQCVKSNVTSVMNVYHVAHTYCTKGLEELLTIKHSLKSNTATLKVVGRAEARLIQLACSQAPDGRTRWTLDLLFEKSKVILDEPVSRSTIGRILKNELQPHLNSYWCIPPKENAEFVACMEDVLLTVD